MPIAAILLGMGMLSPYLPVSSVPVSSGIIKPNLVWLHAALDIHSGVISSRISASPLIVQNLRTGISGQESMKMLRRWPVHHFEQSSGPVC
jgi:hypothetical protein